MAKRSSEILLQVREQMAFLSEIGVDFFLPETKLKPALPASLTEKILSCDLCPLSHGRTQAVPGEGCFDAELMFVGEAPGQEEDLQGKPFVGRAGQLLTRIIEAMNFKRTEVFIANVVKCRPPENRSPSREEIEKCAPYLLTQVRLVRPKVIVSLGKVATDFFVPNRLGMSELRGHFREFEGISVMPTFHPSYLLRNEGNIEVKRLVWQDMQKVMTLLGKK